MGVGPRGAGPADMDGASTLHTIVRRFPLWDATVAWSCLREESEGKSGEEGRVMSIQRAIARLGDQQPRAIDCALISELMVDPQALLWLDIEAPAEEDLAMLREEFHFHE